MAVQFPASPSDAQTISVNGVTYTYSASNTRWTAGASVDLSAVAQDIIPDTDSSRSIGSATKKWQNLHASNIKSGDHLPLTDSAYNLGSPTQKWKSLFLSSNTLFLGDSGSISAGPGGTISLPSIKIGTGTAAVELTASTDGKLATKGTDASGNTEAAASESGAASSVADMAGLIALTGMTTGQTALVSSLNRIFMYTGVGWFKIADMTNESPTAITGVDASISLATDGTATTITAVSTDPEGFPLTWSHAVTTGSLGSTATVAQADNVFTVTPSTVEANAGEFSITFSVTDGATGAVNAVSAFTLSFGFGGTLSYYATSPNQTVTSSGGFGTGVCCNETYSFFSTNHSGNTTHGHIYGYLNSNGTHTKTYNSTSSGAYILGTSNGIACNSTLLAAHEGSTSNGVQLFNIATGTQLHKFAYPTGSGIDNVSGAYWANNIQTDMHGSRPISMSENYIAIGEMSRDVSGVQNGGSIYVYNLSDYSLRFVALPANPYSYSHFMHSDITDNHMIMGNARAGTASNNDEVEIYTLSNNSRLHTISQPNTHVKDLTGNGAGYVTGYNYFGAAVGINSNNYFAIGNPNLSTGVVHVYNTTTGALRYTITSPSSYQGWGGQISMSENEIAISNGGFHHFRHVTNGPYSIEGGVTVHSLLDGSLISNIGRPVPTGGSFTGQVSNAYFGLSQQFSSTGKYLSIGAKGQNSTNGATTGIGVGYIYE